jgi:D-3-phosphoglycerate dehydrogenase
VLAQQRGVEVALTSDTASPDHRSLVRVTLTLTNGKSVSVAGTVAGPRNIAKLVEVDGHDVDVQVSDHLIFLSYSDRPGVVGTIGQKLGEAGINIGGMQVSPDNAGSALVVLTVDSAVDKATLDAISTAIGANWAESVDLVG